MASGDLLQRRPLDLVIFRAVFVGLLVAVAFASASAAQAAVGPIASWGFNDGSGLLLMDSSGTRNGAALIRAVIALTAALHLGEASFRIFFAGRCGRHWLPK